ncbi:hypothetical protein ACHAQH_005457 [Verticillium albo-atrum]
MQPRSQLQDTRRGPLDIIPSTPPLLRPLVRAYLLGYASSVAPRLLTILLQHVSRVGRKRSGTSADAQKEHESFLSSLRHIVLTGFELRRFPAFCALLAGGSTLLEEPFRLFFHRVARRLSEVTRTRLSRWTSTFVAAWLSLRIVQSRICSKFTTTVATKSDVHPGVKEKKVALAGRTLDMTLFAFTRAVDVLVGELWSRRKARRTAGQKWAKLETLIGSSTDPWIFVCSCALIMWAWFYNPSGLPRAYQRWISSAAAVDNRLIEALRRCRSGDLRYGKDTGQAPLLQSMCEDFKWPSIWGDPAKTAPFPCEMVHMGCGPSCEYHALSRLARSWRWSMTMYLPLNLAMQLRKPPTVRGIRNAVLSASRSSAFLGVFIMLFYYGVCLGRSRLGPHIIGKDFAARQKIDGGVCVGCGCFMCGWSVLLETASRRKDMALFVAPRALATLFPRRYAEDKQWRETLVFAASAAVVFTCAKENPARVRGVFGKLLGSVLRV